MSGEVIQADDLFARLSASTEATRTMPKDSDTDKRREPQTSADHQDGLLNKPIVEACRIQRLHLPMYIEEIVADECFDRCIADSYLHEFQHVAAAVALGNDQWPEGEEDPKEHQSGFENILYVAAFKPSEVSDERGVAIISSRVDDSAEKAVIAYAGTIDPETGSTHASLVAAGATGDMEIARSSTLTIAEVHVLTVQALERSIMTPRIRSYMAAGATYLQEKYGLSGMPQSAVEMLYRWATLVAQLDDEGITERQDCIYDSLPAEYYFTQALELSNRYKRRNFGGTALISRYPSHDESYVRCSRCGHARVAGQNCIHCEGY